MITFIIWTYITYTTIFGGIYGAYKTYRGMNAKSINLYNGRILMEYQFTPENKYDIGKILIHGIILGSIGGVWYPIHELYKLITYNVKIDR